MTRNPLRLLAMSFAVTLLTATASFAETVEFHEETKTEVIGPWWAGMVPALLTILIFVLLLIVLGKFAWGPIASGLKAREDKIRQDIQQAEAARAQAEASMRKYQAQLAEAEARVRQMLQDATAEGEKVAAGIRVRATEEGEQIKEKAQREIENARQAAVRDLYDQAATLSTSIAEKILRRNLNVADQQELVSASLDQLQTLNRA